MKIEELIEKVEQHRDACYEELLNPLWMGIDKTYERGYITALNDVLALTEEKKETKSLDGFFAKLEELAQIFGNRKG